MSKTFILTIASLFFIAVAAGIAIFLVKGYTFSPEQKRLVGTGIVTITSEPDSASVYVDGHLTTATDATISSLSPKEYTIKVTKEGFIAWEKKVDVKAGIVEELKVTLFPAIPTIYPLTFTGVLNPVLSPDGEKLAYIVPASTANIKKSGVWIWTMSKNQPISFVRSSEPHQIAQNNQLIDYTKATLKFSPDSKEVLATIGNNNYLLDSDNFNGEPRSITPILDATLKTWETDVKEKDELRVLGIKDLGIRKIASDAAVLKWSPDETKFIYRQTPLSDLEAKGEENVKGFKIYDLVERESYDLPDARSVTFLPDSLHLILVEEGKISVADYDGSNKAVIYAGNFQDNFVFAWPDSSRLVVISSVPTPTASEPNFFGINLK